MWRCASCVYIRDKSLCEEERDIDREVRNVLVA